MLIVRLFLLAPLLSIASTAVAHDEIRPNFEFERNPRIDLPAPVKVFSRGLKPLWMQALARPDADMQRMAAEAIGRAHEAGFPDMHDTIPALTAVLAAPAARPAARLAAARALVLLEAKGAAPQMASSARHRGRICGRLSSPRWESGIMSPTAPSGRVG